MKLAIDVDCVIGEALEFFSVLTKSLRASGHTVYIVTDCAERFRCQREAELLASGGEKNELVITGQKEEFCRKN